MLTSTLYLVQGVQSVSEHIYWYNRNYSSWQKFFCEIKIMVFPVHWEGYWTLLGVLVTSFVRDTVETQWCPDNSDHTACYGPYDSDSTGKHSFAAVSYRAEAILESFGCSNFMVFFNQQNLFFMWKNDPSFLKSTRINFY